jgi:hypothetical protein
MTRGLTMGHPYVLAAGGLLILLGVLLLRWASRHDLKGLAADAAWQVIRNRGRFNVRTELGDRLQDLRAETSNLKRARKVAGHAGRHVVAQALSVAGLVCLAAGAVLIAEAVWWR